MNPSIASPINDMSRAIVQPKKIPITARMASGFDQDLRTQFSRDIICLLVERGSCIKESERLANHIGVVFPYAKAHGVDSLSAQAGGDERMLPAAW